MLTLLSARVGAATYFVRTSGDDARDGLSAHTAFRTLVRAAQSLNHGDSILIGPGNYPGSVLIAEVFGTHAARVTIVGDEEGARTGDPAGPVVLDSTDSAGTAIQFDRVQSLSVSGLTFRGPGAGIKASNCRDVILERSTFRGVSTALAIEACNDVRVESSVFSGANIALNVRGSARVRLAHLTVVGSTTIGLFLVKSADGQIRNCLLAANNSAMAADAVSATTWSSDHNVLCGACGPWGGAPVTAYPAEWFAVSGQERHSIHVAPAFDSNETQDLHINPVVRWGGGLPGMAVGTSLEPPVNLDRDGHPFRPPGAGDKSKRCAGAYDYPDSRGENDWKRLGVATDGAGPRQSAGIYMPDGTLLRMLAADVAGVAEWWWDGRDDEGKPVAPGTYELRSASHDVRVVDDGSIGDNGSARGTYNCDNAHRAVILPDGGFVVSTYYDEAGIPLRFYSASGRSIRGANLVDKEFRAIALGDNGLIAALNEVPDTRLEHILLNGERAPMADGTESYSLIGPIEGRAIAIEQARVAGYRQATTKYRMELKQWAQASSAAEQDHKPFDQKQPTSPAEPTPPLRNYTVKGLAVARHFAYVAIGGFDVVRVVDLATGNILADWPVPGIGDIVADRQGTIWAISGDQIVSLSEGGEVAKRFPSGLKAPQYLAAGGGRLAAGDPSAGRITLLDAGSGKIIRVVGKDMADANAWNANDPEWFPEMRGLAMFPDGRLLVNLHLSVRVIWPETGQRVFEQYSSFLDIAAAHPLSPEYTYSQMGIFHVDPLTRAVQWLTRCPQGWGMGNISVVLGGRPYVGYRNEGTVAVLADVTDPLKPRTALDLVAMSADESFRNNRFSPATFGKGGEALASAGGCQITAWAFKGLDPAGNPTWDYAKATTYGPKTDPSSRGMTAKRDLTAECATGDAYYLAVTPRYNKMVPAWGADGTGVGKTSRDGKAPWFSLSSGGNYQCVTSVRDGNGCWVLACKSFGGQIDVFDTDGLRLTTGNWGWLSNFQSGFVDGINGISSYLRRDGKPGIYVEDDLIGRFLRARLDGGETLVKRTERFDWSQTVSPAPPASPDRAGEEIRRSQSIPRVAAMKVDGDWGAWEKTGVRPQIVSFPFVTWGRIWPTELFDTFKAGTSIGAIVHDGKFFYVYFLTTDDTPHFDSEKPATMFECDSIELWMEEEQFGLGFLKNGRPALYKYRYHNRAGAEWSAGYSLPDSDIWGVKLSDVSSHPLGKQLETATGTSLAGHGGYALMARISFDEVKLVGGLPEVPERRGTIILPTTGKAGEVVRVGVAFDGLMAWGREQDFKVYWPSNVMFSDPTRSTPFVIGDR